MTLDLTIKLRNNRTRYRMIISSFSSEKLGLVSSDQGRVKARAASYVNATLQLQGVEVFDDVVPLIADLAKGFVNFDTVTKIGGELGLGLFDIPLKVHMEVERKASLAGDFNLYPTAPHDEKMTYKVGNKVSLDASKVINVTPRYARLRATGSNGSARGPIIGWQNIELISDRPLETMLKEFKQLKEEYPDRILIASIMEEYNKNDWEELIGRVEETGVDALEINFSCPHGMPERKMGAAVGQDCDLLGEVCGWINAAATVPVWAKMTPNITDITQFVDGKPIGRRRVSRADRD